MTKHNDQTTDNAPDVGQSQVQAAHDEAGSKGYFGRTPDPYPNEAYSLETGPESPPVIPDPHTRSAQHAFRPEESN